MATYGELIGSKFSAEEIATKIGADSVNYQTEEGLIRAIGLGDNSLCMACVNGQYPTEIAREIVQHNGHENSKEKISKRVYER